MLLFFHHLKLKEMKVRSQAFESCFSELFSSLPVHQSDAFWYKVL